MGDLGWNRGLGHTVNSPGHDGGAKPRQEFAGGAAQAGTRGAMASGAPVWASRRRAAGARAPAIALFRGALQISHASIRPHVAHYAPFFVFPDIYLAGVPAAAFSACTAQSARLRTAGTICSPGSCPKAGTHCTLRIGAGAGQKTWESNPGHVLLLTSPWGANTNILGLCSNY